MNITKLRTVGLEYICANADRAIIISESVTVGDTNGPRQIRRSFLRRKWELLMIPATRRGSAREHLESTHSFFDRVALLARTDRQSFKGHTYTYTSPCLHAATSLPITPLILPCNIVPLL